MKGIRRFLVVALFVLFLTGCSSLGTGSIETQEAELAITGLNTSIGGDEDNLDEQVFSYSLDLSNQSSGDVIVRWIEPDLAGDITQRVLTEDLRVSVNEPLPPGSNLEVTGSFRFNASGLTKQQILEMEPFLSGFTVSSEKSLPLPGS